MTCGGSQENTFSTSPLAVGFDFTNGGIKRAGTEAHPYVALIDGQPWRAKLANNPPSPIHWERGRR